MLMTQVPATQYAQSGEISIAYQVTGNGPLDVIMTPGFVSHLDCCWEEPSFARQLQRLASFCRLIRFDKRGTGLSDREAGIPSLEQRMDDIRTVMDAAPSPGSAGARSRAPATGFSPPSMGRRARFVAPLRFGTRSAGSASRFARVCIRGRSN
jgi:hypothetical protein